MMRQLFPRCAARAPAFFAKRSTLPVWQAARQYSISPEKASDSNLQDIDPAQLVLQKTSQPKPLKNAGELIFGQNFTGSPLCPYRTRNMR
jgi:branched-chain amino acid aminotransferase